MNWDFVNNEQKECAAHASNKKSLSPNQLLSAEQYLYL